MKAKKLEMDACRITDFLNDRFQWKAFKPHEVALAINSGYIGPETDLLSLVDENCEYRGLSEIAWQPDYEDTFGSLISSDGCISPQSEERHRKKIKRIKKDPAFAHHQPLGPGSPVLWCAESVSFYCKSYQSRRRRNWLKNLGKYTDPTG